MKILLGVLAACAVGCSFGSAAPPPPLTPPGPPPLAPRDASGFDTVYVGAGVGLGVALPAKSPGVTSFAVDGRFVVDVTRYAQLSGVVTAYLPGVKVPGETDILGAGTAEARVFPILLGRLRPYGGAGVGGAFVTATGDHCDTLFNTGCPQVSHPAGLTLKPFVGVRYDIPFLGVEGRSGEPGRWHAAHRILSLYAEAGYTKIFAASGGLDHVYFTFGPSLER